MGSQNTSDGYDVTNRYGVGVGPGDDLVILDPPSTLTAEQALVVAAWLRAHAEPMTRVSFESVYHDVLSS